MKDKQKFFERLFNVGFWLGVFAAFVFAISVVKANVGVILLSIGLLFVGGFWMFTSFRELKDID